MRNLLFTLSYDGTAYHGWQVQKNADTVQKRFQNALETVTGERSGVVGCSRTDAGVHAKMFCCNSKVSTKIPEKNLIRALNCNLPDDIAVTDICEKDMEFHARYSCKGKEYLYNIWNSHIRDPFVNRYSMRYDMKLDIDTLNEGCKAFIGKHDFAGFCSAGSNVQDTIRTIYDAHFERKEDMVRLYISGDGFLYNMVRIIVGTFLYVAQGKIEVGDLKSIIDSTERNRAGITAPAHGLFLNKVFY